MPSQESSKLIRGERAIFYAYRLKHCTKQQPTRSIPYLPKPRPVKNLVTWLWRSMKTIINHVNFVSMVLQGKFFAIKMTWNGFCFIIIIATELKNIHSVIFKPLKMALALIHTLKKRRVCLVISTPSAAVVHDTCSTSGISQTLIYHPAATTTYYTFYVITNRVLHVCG